MLTVYTHLHVWHCFYIHCGCRRPPANVAVQSGKRTACRWAQKMTTRLDQLTTHASSPDTARRPDCDRCS